VKKQDVELIQFKKYEKETLISVNVVLSEEEALLLEDIWFNKLESCQVPLVNAAKNGFIIHIPWILKKKEETKK